MSAADSRFSLRVVSEARPLESADYVAKVLAAHPLLARQFPSFLAGLTFRQLPSMTPGSTALEASVDDGMLAQHLLEALDSLYHDIETADEIARARGDILERYIWHRLERKFPLRITACEVLDPDRVPISTFKLDAATRPDTPAVGIEAKSSEYALVGGGRRPKPQRIAKAKWVATMASQTAEQIVGVFVTWGAEHAFRRVLTDLGGRDLGDAAIVIAHNRVADLPGHVEKALKQAK